MSSNMIKRLVIAGLLILAGIWSVSSAPAEGGFANSNLLATPQWVSQNMTNEDVIIVDVREDKYVDNNVIPGAIHMPWRLFRKNDLLYGLGGVFVGLDEAQRILGDHGISRSDTVVLYDSVQRDGGATSSYVFWVLDLLGHKDVRILERGVDGWQDAGFTVDSTPAKREALLYQAPLSEVKVRKRISGSDIYQRLGDPYYQILDVRSEQEYLGEKPNTGLDGTVLKLGHIPTAFNIDYTLNWASPETKAIKSYNELANLYAGLDPSRGTVVYCHSGRRGSFGYFILRLMGFEDVMLYENSWFEWGAPDNFYPVETKANTPTRSYGLPSANAGSNKTRMTQPASSASSNSTGSKASGSNDGYISCGG
ncbi:Sulfurtransferase [Pseudodesulfovibrio profundus]|uniref:Sulfurtransferase n=1 Tax=Pseudodesulfovibrio profundus TaxID=57320 RepID=A0A2C8FDD8_9BACT|nr:rhodanese-like domain-containing protein [Pseudodesulfovibrio profundus]SOB60471.1 Sulfurtransferase [Pseudodesulfovibrio profundus]